MSRSFSVTAMREILAPESGDWLILLLTIDHADLDEPLRVSSDNTTRIRETDEAVVYGTTSRGVDYVFYPLSMGLPSDEDGAAPRTTLTIDNVDRTVVETVRGLTSPPSVAIEAVMGSAPDEVQMSLPNFALINVEYDRVSVTGEIVVDILAGEPMPARKYRPGSHPGLFK